MASTSGSPLAADAAPGSSSRRRGEPHIVDLLIDERSVRLSRHPLWPLVRPLLLRFFHYRQALRMCDEIAGLSGGEALAFLSRLLELDLSVTGADNLPASGGFILAPNHPTGIADGIAVFDLLKERRPDMAIFANRDAIRAAPGLRDVIIPVEWRQSEKSHARSRDTLEGTARAFAQRKAVVLFPSGRIAWWNEGALTERPWQTSIVVLARRYGFPVVPANVTARNSGLFYFLSRLSTELRDITVFHEFLNKKGQPFSIVVGRPVPPEALAGEPAAVTARLQHHTVTRLRENPDAVFA
ncbi:MAG TPA: acyltransferase [Rhizobiales bacterium]|nr:acyltransferase [Hyphomicrobiales bacterium]